MRAGALLVFSGLPVRCGGAIQPEKACRPAGQLFGGNGRDQERRPSSETPRAAVDLLTFLSFSPPSSSLNDDSTVSRRTYPPRQQARSSTAAGHRPSFHSKPHPYPSITTFSPCFTPPSASPPLLHLRSHFT